MSSPLLVSQHDEDPGIVRARAEFLREEMVARVQADGNDFDALHTLGASLFVLGSYQSANNVLARAIMLDSSHAWTWYWMARNCEAMGDPAAAAMANDRALELDAENLEFQLFRGRLARALRRRN